MAPIDKESGIHNWGAPALGIMRMVSYIKHKLPWVNIETYDSQVDFFDPIEKWAGRHVDILGVSLLHYTLFNSLGLIIAWKKKHPESLIVVGGNEAGANYQQILDNSPVDIMVTAEGEDTLFDIILWKCGEISLEEIDGIIWRSHAVPITNERLWEYWRWVDFSQFRYEDYWDQRDKLYESTDRDEHYVRLMTTSHCMRNCTFCSLSKIRNIACGKKVKPAILTGEQIMELVTNIHNQLPQTTTLYFTTDDVLYPDPKHFLDFCKLYTKSNYKYRIMIQTSSYSLEYWHFPILKEINCEHITIGVENASEKVRKEFNKPQSEEKLERFIELGKRYNMRIYYLIILIPPYSTVDDLLINYYKISEWFDRGAAISIEPLVYSYKGTPIYDDVRFNSSKIERFIPGTKIKVTDSEYILPSDPLVKKIALDMLAQKDEFIDNYFKSLPTKHKFKGLTSKPILLLLKKLLQENGVWRDKI